MQSLRIKSGHFNRYTDDCQRTDFPNVTLVGVLAADMSLHVSDFRSRTDFSAFDAGSWSREEEGKGEAIIRRMIQALCNYDRKRAGLRGFL